MEPSIRPTAVRVRGFPGLELETAEICLRRVINKELSAPSSDNSYELSFVPACDSKNELVALVDFRHGLPEFLSQLRQNPLDSWQVFVEELNDDLSFDSHFIGFTQLYGQDPSQVVSAEYKSPSFNPTVPRLMHWHSIIAISGIDGHAYGSWRGRGPTRRMWLRHFLKKDLPNCRTMIYGYDSKLAKRGFAKIEDYARGFLEDLKEIRQEEVRSKDIGGSMLIMARYNNDR